MHSQKSQPPKLLLKFFRWFCHPDLSKYVEGDLLELHQYNIKKEGAKKAQWLFTWEVLKLFRPSIIKKFEGNQRLNNYGMFKHNLKTSVRVIQRDKLYTGINVLGLTSGMVIAMLILFYVRFEFGYESYNPNADRVVRITMDYYSGETLSDQDCETYHPLGPMIKEEFPEVTEFTRAYRMEESVIKAEDQHFRVPRILAVDPSFLQLFNYPLIQGNSSSALKQPNQIVLTESAAKTYFGSTDVVGKSLWLSETNSMMNIEGVIRDSPGNTHLKFDMVISYATIQNEISERRSQWNQNDTFTYLQLESPENYEIFKSKLDQLSDRLIEEDKINLERVISQKIGDIHLYSNKTYEAEKNGDAVTVFFMLGVALLVILIAIVNYVNLSTAKSLDRAKEVGIRKVVGSTLAQLRMRFFIESVLMNGISALLALGIIFFVFTKFKLLAGLPSSLSFYDSPFFWGLFTSIFIIGSLLSGIFPAFVLSSFKPVAVLKGKFTHSKNGGLLRKSLVVFQFAIAIFLLVQTFTASEQLSYMQKKDLGLSTEKVVVVRGPAMEEEVKNYSVFTESILSRASFQSAALSNGVPGLPTSQMSSTTGIDTLGHSQERGLNFFLYSIDQQFIPTMKMELIGGENFTQESKYEHSVIVNEEAIRLWGYPSVEAALGKKLDMWGNTPTITGVLKNFHQTGVKSAHIPMLFFPNSKYGDMVSIQLSDGDLLGQIDEIEQVYEATFPNSPFEFFFLDQEFEKQFRADQQFQKVFGLLSLFALLITCLGLFGLASFTVAKRAKEIGIRKVLGASVPEIITLLSRDFIMLVLISSLIATPITYYLIEGWLTQYAFRIELNIWLFLLPAVLVLLVAFSTIFSRTFQISRANPVESLKDE